MTTSLLRRVRRWATTLLHQTDGRLTRELVLHPSRFGLGRMPRGQQPNGVVDSVCGFCSTGCQLRIHLQDEQAIGLSPSPEATVNRGMACPKGWEALAVLSSPERATLPLVRQPDGSQRPVDWPAAMDHFMRGLRRVQQTSGPESVAFLGTGQLPTEELAFFGALCKFGLGMVHGDANTRQCMATAAVAYKQSFGFDAPPFTYADFEQSDVLVFVGANPCIAHPILWERVLRNRRSPHIVVIDPRRTETAMQAATHLAIRPKSDLLLLYSVAHVLIARDWIDADFIAAHTTEFEAFREHVLVYAPEAVAAACGVSPQAIVDLATLIHRGQAVSFWWTMGVNQSYQGVRTAQALINLALMTGHIGRPGTGPNSITGQCNAMGSRLYSNTTSLLGGRDFANSQHRQDVARILGIDAQRIPNRHSDPYPQILQGVREGRIKGLWIVGTNPAHSWIDQQAFLELRDRLEWLVVQDMYATSETAQLADLVLPAAGWGEKDGTLINSERRIGIITKVAQAPGQALADFAIFRLISEAAGCGEVFRAWTDPEAVFRLLQQLSAGQPCDITGIDGYAMLRARHGVQWPCPSDTLDPAPERRQFEDGRFFTPDHKAVFRFDAHRPLPEPPCQDYPLILLTGRGSVAQWHTETRTRQSAVLRKLSPQGLHLEIHPDDAAALGIAAHNTVSVASRRGQLTAVAWLTPTVARGQVFLPMHDPRVNQLTRAEFDPWSFQPSYKDCAVRVTPVAHGDRSVPSPVAEGPKL